MCVCTTYKSLGSFDLNLGIAVPTQANGGATY